MVIKLYAEFEGQTKQELGSQIQLLTDLAERFGVKEITFQEKKLLGREELKDRRYEYHLIEPLGGNTLQQWMHDGKRFNLWVVFGEVVNMGQREVFTPVETYVVRNLLPHSRVLSIRSNQVSLFLATLERLVRQEPTAA
jgi:hypothetical protein